MRTIAIALEFTGDGTFLWEFLLGPFGRVAGSTPRAQKVAFLIEFEDRRRGDPHE